MIQRYGTVATPLAGTYLVRLCKHFSKKISVDYNPDDSAKGYARFPFGECQLSANEVELSFSCRADNMEAMAQMQSVISQHVGMFTKRNPLLVDWQGDN